AYPTAPESQVDSPCSTSDLIELNTSLLVLAAIFPDVRPEVFREMLGTFSAESRLYVVAEQLLRHKAEWVKDRWRIPSKEDGSKTPVEAIQVDKAIDAKSSATLGKALVPVEEQFRTESYKRATRRMLYQEFRALSKSTIDGVLAERNFSYTLARPTLQTLLARTWRNSLSNFLSKWRRPTQEATEKHYMLVWLKQIEGESFMAPSLRETGNEELDQELFNSVLNPVLRSRKAEQETADIQVAMALNLEEAQEALAIYECECCFSDTTFEEMATCSTGIHTICFSCIRRAVNEALYGQSWGLSIDHSRGQFACLAPTSPSRCTGCIPHKLAFRAVTTSKGGQQTWQKFQSRLADEALLKSQSQLVRCPFCPYAELSDLYLPPSTLRYRLKLTHPLRTLVLLVLPISFLGLVLLYAFIIHLFPSSLPSPRSLLFNAFSNLIHATHLSPRFRCRSSACALPSCLLCHKRWVDPHTCHESATLSLRTTVEAARTAALKRTCPRCGLGFVKESGCNKLVCLCGYVMCYVCRQGLGRGAGNRSHGFGRAGAAVEEEGEGYRHFCQHFRPAGGRCTECERCDLYRGEDEDEVVKRAGEMAEKEWREREGMVGVEGLSVDGFKEKGWGGSGRICGVQELVDWWVRQPSMPVKVSL
ncbi:hypothetical protein MMC06_006843, partial [Schaereria dolodes]|nr:hypothetical protein [Schaereria dolodes]